jgi:hypothetical protein
MCALLRRSRLMTHQPRLALFPDRVQSCMGSRPHLANILAILGNTLPELVER